jgi:hypothetical protein
MNFSYTLPQDPLSIPPSPTSHRPFQLLFEALRSPRLPTLFYQLVNNTALIEFNFLIIPACHHRNPYHIPFSLLHFQLFHPLLARQPLFEVAQTVSSVEYIRECKDGQAQTLFERCAFDGANLYS